MTTKRYRWTASRDKHARCAATSGHPRQSLDVYDACEGAEQAPQRRDPGTQHARRYGAYPSDYFTFWSTNTSKQTFEKSHRDRNLILFS
jgi:hypothetical protein